jgi:hypothetical protein
MNQFSNYFKFLEVAEDFLKVRNDTKQSEAERIERRPRPEQFEAVEPPVPPTQWCDNDLFTAGYPAGWFETTPTEPPIEGSSPVLVLRRDVTGMPDDLGSRGVIRCFRVDRRRRSTSSTWRTGWLRSALGRFARPLSTRSVFCQ